MKEAFAYIDPGNGFTFFQNTSFLWPAIVSLIKFAKIFFWIIIVIFIIIIGRMMIGKKGVNKKVIIIGVDAMDPNITERLMNEGKLPNLSGLKNNGSYSRFQTTYPAESVVAWSSF